MRVLQIHNRYANPGGEDVVVDLERKVLRAAGHQVEALEVQNQQGLQGAVSLAASPWNVASARRLASVIEEFQPSVAHVHNTWFRLGPSIYPVLKRAGLPVVMTAHNYRLTCLNGQLFREGAVCTRCVGHYPLPGVVRSCYRDSFSQSAVMAVGVSIGRVNSFWEGFVDRLVAMTEFERDLLVEIGVPIDQIVVKPHFVEDEGTRTLPPSASDTVVFVGRLSEEKGVATLVEAWAEARPTGLRLVVIGDGPERAQLQAHAPSSVEFVGWLDRREVASWLRDARALAFPSIWYEPFGMVLIEAMATGTPVVASQLGGIPQVVGDGGDELLAKPGDVQSWAGRIRALQDASVDLDAIGRTNRATYEARYSVAHGLSGLERLYQSVLR